MYDKDSSGAIDLEEMVEIFCLMYAVQVELWRYGDGDMMIYVRYIYRYIYSARG